MKKLAVIESGTPLTTYLSELKEGDSRATAKTDLRTFVRVLEHEDIYTFPWESLDLATIKQVRAMLHADVNRGPKTVNKIMTFVKGVMRCAWDAELVDDSVYLRISQMRPLKVGKKVDTGRAIAPADQITLIRTCEQDNTPAGYRDAAILALMLSTGVRRSEIANMLYDDYDPATGTIILRNRKNNDDDTVVVRNGGKETLDHWTRIRGSQTGYMFLRLRKGGKILPEPMSRQSIHDSIQRRITQAGIEHFSSHDLRRTLASQEFSKGTPAADIAAMLGHKSLDQTMQYDRSAEERKAAMADNIDIPCNR